MDLAAILLVVSMIMEPCIYLYAMCIRFKRNYEDIKPYMAFLFLDTGVLLINQFTSISEITGNVFFTVLEFGYIVAFMQIAFNGKLIDKVVHVGILFIISLVSDCIVVLIFWMFTHDTKSIAEAGVLNSVASIASKGIFVITMNLIYMRKKVEISTAVAPAIMLVLILELPSVAMFKNESVKISTIATYIGSQIAAGGIMAYLIRLYIRKKEEGKVKVIQLEEKVKEYKNRATELECRADEYKRVANELMEKAGRVKEKNGKMLRFVENRKEFILSSNDIISFERVGRKILITTNSSTHEVNESIASIERSVGNMFVKVNQGVLVNRQYIKKLDGEILYMANGAEFVTSRERAKTLKEEILI